MKTTGRSATPSERFPPGRPPPEQHVPGALAVRPEEQEHERRSTSAVSSSESVATKSGDKPPPAVSSRIPNAAHRREITICVGKPEQSTTSASAPSRSADGIRGARRSDDGGRAGSTVRASTSDCTALANGSSGRSTARLAKTARRKLNNVNLTQGWYTLLGNMDKAMTMEEDITDYDREPGERVLIVEDDPATRTGSGGARPGLGIPDRRGVRRRGRLSQGHQLPAGHHRERPRDAADGRSRPAPHAEGSAVGHHLHPADGAGHDRERRRRDQGRRLRLSEQARRPAAAAESC